MKILVVLDPILRNLGGFKIPLVLVSLLVLVVIVMLVIDTFFKKEVDPERRKQSLNALLVLGSMNAALGMLGQIMGIWYALAAILQAADISPAIVIGGLQASFGTTYYGFITFFVAMFAWLIFSYVPKIKSTNSALTF
jgi:flagellar motor component MotA